MPQQIQISDELWKYLNSSKEPGETFDDVIVRLFNLYKILEREVKK